MPDPTDPTPSDDAANVAAVVPDGPTLAALPAAPDGRSLRLRFDEVFKPEPARDRPNHRLYELGTWRRKMTKQDRPVPSRVNLGGSGQTVTLRPARTIPRRDSAELIVIGAGPGGVEDTAGQALDGPGSGVPGTDLVLVLPPVDGKGAGVRAPAVTL